MSEELKTALQGFDWTLDPPSNWRIHYDPAANGNIVEIVNEKFSTSELPYIEITENLATQFIDGTKYTREYKVTNAKLEFNINEHNVYKASDARVGQVTLDDEITPGVYFATVRGEPDLVIDTIEVDADNIEAETQRIMEYLKNNDIYKDSE
tara:strand:- start:404 stop:859 length:456 start_codon:yes stop_codon:yes gene_type:complete